MSEYFNEIISRLKCQETFTRNPTSLQFFFNWDVVKKLLQVLAFFTFTGEAVILIFPHDTASSGLAPESLPSNSCPVFTNTEKSAPLRYVKKKTQIMTKYLHKATSFYTETSRHLMIRRKVSYFWRFVEVLSDLINFSWYPFSGLAFLEKG